MSEEKPGLATMSGQVDFGVITRAEQLAMLFEQSPSFMAVLDGRVTGSRKIDLLLTDVGLPGGMNGRQLAMPLVSADLISKCCS